MKGKKERREERKKGKEYLYKCSEWLTIVDIIILEDTSNPSTRSTMVKKLCTLCSRWFSSKTNLNRHVKDLHHTKTAYLNSTFAEGVCARSVGWGNQSGGGSGPLSKVISIKENGDKYSDTSNSSDVVSATSNCSDADSATSNCSDAVSDTSKDSNTDSATSNCSDVVSDTSKDADTDLGTSSGSDADSDTSNSSDASSLGTRSDVWEIINHRMNRKKLTLKEKEDEILEEFHTEVRLYRCWINDPIYLSVMKTVNKMPKYMDFEEALNCAIQKRKFLIRRKIDDTSDEEAGSGDGEESRSSNFSENDSCDPDGWDKPLALWGGINHVMGSRGLTLKQKDKNPKNILQYSKIL